MTKELGDYGNYSWTLRNVQLISLVLSPCERSSSRQSPTFIHYIIGWLVLIQTRVIYLFIYSIRIFTRTVSLPQVIYPKKDGGMIRALREHSRKSNWLGRISLPIWVPISTPDFPGPKQYRVGPTDTSIPSNTYTLSRVVGARCPVSIPTLNTLLM